MLRRISLILLLTALSLASGQFNFKPAKIHHGRGQTRPSGEEMTKQNAHMLKKETG